MTYAVILAGGWGERLWPMSTRARPKQLLKLTGDSTLVGDTLRRIAGAVSLADALVMTSAALRDAMVEELSLIPSLVPVLLHLLPRSGSRPRSPERIST